MDLFWIMFWVLASMSIAQGAGTLWTAIAFRKFVFDWGRREAGDYRPRAAVFLPCKGIDSLLADTIKGLSEQQYPDYRVYCTFESEEEPAKAFIEAQMARLGLTNFHTVVARITKQRSQKIENLLAAIDEAGDWPEVYAFVDSDAVPGPRWLSHLVSPLQDSQVGASTGYRWYHPGGTFVEAVRCLWNAAALIFLGDHKRNFCWGGSMAVRREVFARTEVRSRWESALSEDYQVNRAMRDHGLRIAFTPGCVIPSSDPTDWGDFWTFSRRQLIITRVCEPRLWWMIAAITVAYVTGFWLATGMLLSGLLSRNAHLTWMGGGLFAVLYALSAAKVVVRHGALRALIRIPGSALKASLWDLAAGPLMATFNLALMVASGASNRFYWRGVHYQMDSPLRTQVLGRKLL